MSRLPVIVGFGGYNAAGRSSFHHGFRRMVIESMDPQARQETLAGLAVMMKLVKAEGGRYLAEDGTPLSPEDIERRYAERIFASTLVRRIEPQYLDPDAVHWHKVLELSPAEGQALTFKASPKQLPEPLPANWSIAPAEDGEVLVSIHERCEFKVDSYRALTVKSAGQLPTGFEPGELYNSRFHPRGLQMSVVAATDAIRSTGIDWKTIVDNVQPDEIAVFSGSIMSQLDDNGFGGLMQSRLKGHRVSAKQLPLGFNSMPTDFINAYVLGSVGMTGSITGACATFLYNLQKGIDVITSGQARVVIVGNSEAPILPECIEGYSAMGALATEEGLRLIEGRDDVDFRRASRPFGENCGFTLAESSQYVVLMDDELALRLGADIHGAVTDVFINADGFKKSISAPARQLPDGSQGGGQRGADRRPGHRAPRQLRPRPRLQHASQPGHRIGNPRPRGQRLRHRRLAGHRGEGLRRPLLATASADQLISALGTFKYGILPGIKTIDKVADDVHQQRLSISNRDMRQDKPLEVCFINSKGFGGNNASGVVLSPRIAEKMLRKRHGQAAFAAYVEKREQTRAAARAYDQRALQGDLEIIYNFGQDLIDEHAIEVSAEQVTVPGFSQPLVYKKDARFSDMLD